MNQLIHKLNWLVKLKWTAYLNEGKNNQVEPYPSLSGCHHRRTGLGYWSSSRSETQTH